MASDSALEGWELVKHFFVRQSLQNKDVRIEPNRNHFVYIFSIRSFGVQDAPFRLPSFIRSKPQKVCFTMHLSLLRSCLQAWTL